MPSRAAQFRVGGPLEERFVQAMTASRGSPAIFVSRPIAAALALLAAGLWLAPAVGALRARVSSRRLP